MLKKNLEHSKSKAWGATIALFSLLALPPNVMAQNTSAEYEFRTEQLKRAQKAIRMQDFQLAFSLYQNAANAGSSEAQFQLASLYGLGQGTQANDELSVQWLEKSAKQNHPAALYHLALELNQSKPLEARGLMQRSAALSYAPAMNYMDKAGSLSKTSLSSLEDNESSLWFGSARKNSVSDLEHLYENGQTIDITDNSGRTALIVAIEFKSTEAINWLLQNQANPNHQDSFGNTPLFIAATHGDSDTLKILIDAGADPQQTLPNGDNLWHHSIRLRQVELAGLLFKSNININRENKDGWTPLDVADYFQDRSLIVQLTQKGAIHGSGWSNRTLEVAEVTADQFLDSAGNSNVKISEIARVVLSGNISLTEQLFEKHPALINQQLDDGSTLLTAVTKESNLEMIEVLLNNRADVNQPSSGGITALHVAARSGNTQIITRLLNQGANPRQSDHNELDAIDWAIQEKQELSALMLLGALPKSDTEIYENYLLGSAQFDLTETSKLLINKSKQLLTDDKGRNALWYAAYNKNIRIINALAVFESNDTTDNLGKTPFFVAAERGCLDCVKALISPKNINQQTNSGNTPLITASKNADINTVKWLLETNADTELRNNQGNTPLITAVERDDFDIVKLLVESGAKVARKNKLGFSAMDIAQRKNQEIFTYLKDKSVLGIFK